MSYALDVTPIDAGSIVCKANAALRRRLVQRKHARKSAANGNAADLDGNQNLLIVLGPKAFRVAMRNWEFMLSVSFEAIEHLRSCRITRLYPTENE